MGLVQEEGGLSGTKEKIHALLFVGAGGMETNGGLCCGVIGQGGTFCVKRDCIVVAHRTMKFKVTSEALYVLKKQCRGGICGALCAYQAPGG